MSYLYFGNLAVSVPPVLDTTPCMNEMLNYEDCIYDANIQTQEIIHPNWPTLWPRLLTDGKLLEFDKIPYHPDNVYNYTQYEMLQQLTVTHNMAFFNSQRPLTKKNKQYLWECEEERFVFKACLRKVVGLKRTPKHTSWDTAEVSNIQLTQLRQRDKNMR